ncbi:MAG: hypothetical protein V4497_01845 [Bacteroidota bacterium]
MEKNIDIRENAIEWYISNELIYKKLAKKIDNILTEIFNSRNINYHIVNSRSKDIDSFREKINNEKYDNPIEQIKDLAGIRIITYVEDEVEIVCKLIEEIFNIDKVNSLDKSTELGIDKVGYKSVHFVASLKDDRLKLPEYKIFENRFFEIQVRTILQHAWAEIEHDRNYKFSGKLPNEINRRFKLLAGSLEISDREFNNISREIDEISKEVETRTKKGNLNFELSSTSVKQFLETRFKELFTNGYELIQKMNDNIINELSSFDLKTLQDLDKIIPKDLIKVLQNNKIELKNRISFTGLVRLILIINNSEKYFTKSWDTQWKTWSSEKNFDNIFNHYKVDKKGILEKYDVEL